MTDFDDAIELVFDDLLPQAEAQAAATNRTIKACMVSLLQPYAKAYLFPALKEAKLDNRTRRWNVRLIFATINSIDFDGFGEIISVSDPELVQGFDEVREMIIDYAQQTHEKSGIDIRILPSFSETNLKKRLGGMRPAISRGGGRAHTVIQHMVNEHHYICKLEISREDIPLDNPVEDGQ